MVGVLVYVANIDPIAPLDLTVAELLLELVRGHGIPAFFVGRHVASILAVHVGVEQGIGRRGAADHVAGLVDLDSDLGDDDGLAKARGRLHLDPVVGFDLYVLGEANPHTVAIVFLRFSIKPVLERAVTAAQRHGERRTPGAKSGNHTVGLRPRPHKVHPVVHHLDVFVFGAMAYVIVHGVAQVKALQCGGEGAAGRGQGVKGTAGGIERTPLVIPVPPLPAMQFNPVAGWLDGARDLLLGRIVPNGHGLHLDHTLPGIALHLDRDHLARFEVGQVMLPLVEAVPAKGAPRCGIVLTVTR